MEPKNFIDHVLKKKRVFRKDRVLPENSVSAFLAGMCCAMDAIEAGSEDCCGWIPVSVCQPQELTDHINPDELSYEVVTPKVSS